jgi:hypothetical protein
MTRCADNGSGNRDGGAVDRAAVGGLRGGPSLGNSFRLVMALACLAAVCGGCGANTPSRSVTIDTWRDGLQKYVDNVGKGDPAVLRDTTYLGRPAFAQIGDPIAAEGTDAIGVLLGHKAVAGRPSFVYLVGLVKKEAVEDIRLAVAQPIPSQGQKTQFKWLVSKEEKQPTQRYINYRKQLFAQRFPGRKDVPPEYTTFPGEGDTFDLQVTPAEVTATHAASGAVWRLPISGR